jgi:hypothetical protein
MRLRVGHARERVSFRCICLVRHVCKSVCEEKERAEKEKKSAGLNYALQPLGKFRGHEILGL